MTKLKNPLFSFEARGTLARAISYVKRRTINIAEGIPTHVDANSPTQKQWRPMFQKCIDLWHLLSDAEKREFEIAAVGRHMTGYAWYMSQCLRPNPGIYLPLAGGTMQGDIDMDAHRLLDLPDPLLPQEPATKAYADAIPGGYTEGCRVYNDAPITTVSGVQKHLPFNQERYDTDNIHSTTFATNRLTCRTAGVYIISAIVRWAGTTASQLRVAIYLNNTVDIGYQMLSNPDVAGEVMNPTCLYTLAIDDYVEVRVYQISGADLVIMSEANYSPVFMMQRIG